MKTMTCEEVLTNISCFLDGDGSADIRKALMMHTRTCRKCQILFETTRRMMSIVREVEPFDVPLAARARLYTRIEEGLAP
jgi:hypothetical protein